MSKSKKVLEKGEATPIIANTEKKETTTIASVVQQRLANLGKREKRLVEIIEKRTAYLAKLQKRLDSYKTSLEKVKADKEAELKSIQEFATAFNNISKA